MSSTASLDSSDLINEQTIPPAAWAEAQRRWRNAHGDLHRGRFQELYVSYVEGLAAGLEVEVTDLLEHIENRMRS